MHPVDGQHRFLLLRFINRVSCIGKCPLKLQKIKELLDLFDNDILTIPYQLESEMFSAPFPQHPESENSFINLRNNK